MRDRSRSAIAWARDAMARHPRLPRAVKAAVAAVLAWLIVQPLGGVGDDYPYYAPLGAVIAVSSTVVESLRSSLRGLAAILAGAVLAVTIGPLLPGVLALAVVVLIGTLIAGWWRLGDMGGWVPISALFVLIIGHVDTGAYVLGYLGLTGLGALVGVGINAAFPPLPLTPGRYQIASVRRSVAAQLEDLAGALRHEEPLTREEWVERYHGVRPHADAMSRLVNQTAEARRVNWRVRRWRREADRQADHARALERLSLVVDDLATVLIDTEEDTGPALRGSAADALESVAAILRADDQDRRRLEEAAEEAVAHYVRTATDQVRESDSGLLATGAIATALTHVVASSSGRQR